VRKMEQAIEGITPSMLWTFCVVLVGLLALVVLVYKVIEIMRKERERRENREQLVGQGIEERIANAVMIKLTPELEKKFNEVNKKFDDVNNQFTEIDKKLSNDKESIESHTRQLNAYEDRVDQLEDGNRALCHGVFALLSHEVNGNSIDKLTKAHHAMQNYLIDGTYRESDWA